MSSTAPVSADCDVLVLGSGASALVAALKAATSGMKVIVCEKTSKLGGTSAMSAGGIWIPANHLEADAGIVDSEEDALAYIAASLPEVAAEETRRWRQMLRAGPLMLRLLEERTPLRFCLTGEPDPHFDAPGARSMGRMLSALPISRFSARSFALRVRGSTLPEIFTYHEVIETDLYHKPISTTLRLLPRLIGRVLTLRAGKGTALMLGLVRGCLDAGCEFRLASPARRLIVEDERVQGAIVEHGGQAVTLRAVRGTVIATGGFEWNEEMMERHFPGPLQFLGGVDANTGDGHRMAEEAGAELRGMDQANVTAAIPRRYEGRVHGMPVPYHAEPNAIVVGRDGKRFVDELDFNIGAVLNERNAEGQPIHLPAFVISDAHYLRRAPLVWYFSRFAPDWLVRAKTLPDLASRIGLDPKALVASVAHYNSMCEGGVDLDFGRGKTRAHQKADKRKKLGLEPILQPPFVAIRFDRSIMTTKGGPHTNEYGQALRADGSVINGLYCAGGSMSNPIGSYGVGAGTTLGPFMSHGYLCAEHIVG